MENPLEKKRRGYLSFFCDGVIDSVTHRELDIKKKSSAYYKQGYDFGLTFRGSLTKEDLNEIKQEKK